MSRKNLLISITLSVSVFAFLLVATEAVLRIYARGTSADICAFNRFKEANISGDAGFYQLADNQELIIELRPGAKKDEGGVDIHEFGPRAVRINKDGQREDHEYALPKPQGTFRIAVVGDSVTFGWGVEAESSYPKILEAALRDMDAEEKFEVINFAVPGYNGKQKLITLKEKVVKYDPDLVLVGWLIDDYSVSSYAFSSLLPLGGSAVKFFNANSYLFACLREKLDQSIQTFSATPYKEVYEKNAYGRKISKELFDEFAAFSREKKIPVIVTVLPAWQPLDKSAEDGIVTINRLLTKMAGESGLYSLDLMPVVGGLEKLKIEQPTFFSVAKSDIYHPNQIGHAFIIPVIYNYLIKNKLIPLNKFITEIKLINYDPEAELHDFKYMQEYKYEYSDIIQEVGLSGEIISY